MDFRDLSRWVRGSGLQIVMIAIGAALVGRFIHWVGARYRKHIDDEVRDQIEKGGVVSEHAKRSRTVAQVVEWASEVVLYFLAGLLVLNRAGIPFSGLVAPATVAGAAIGFGAQQIVQDLLSGFFLFAERQFSVGDLVRLAQPGQAGGISGTVEELTLRVTRLRTVQGELVFIPNGALRQVTNLSKEWSRVVVDIPVPADQDIETAVSVLREVAATMGQDPEWKGLLMGAPVLAGVENFEVGYLQLRLIARTLPGKQFEVGRELRLRAALALQDAGVRPPAINVRRADS
ncbi:MAG: moderate conductance mechanosensitive channel [Acidimicrobiaceae bacterium]|jgi:small conductance mechanosensitive channel|nr:moderate conductance mechanosensitive channel [Acidimicrobiaceae bacterium]